MLQYRRSSIKLFTKHRYEDHMVLCKMFENAQDCDLFRDNSDGSPLTAAGTPQWCHRPKNREFKIKSTDGISFHLHVEALWCVALIDPGAVK